MSSIHQTRYGSFELKWRENGHPKSKSLANSFLKKISVNSAFFQISFRALCQTRLALAKRHDPYD